MHVNPDKSLLLLRSAGSTLAKWVKARTFKRQDRKFIRLGTPFQPIDVALANTVPYFGTVMSFDAFETRAADLRIRQAKAAVARLGRVLFKKQGLSYSIAFACTVGRTRTSVPSSASTTCTAKGQMMQPTAFAGLGRERPSRRVTIGGGRGFF